MKEYHLLVWITQLGLGVAVPLAAAAYLGLWLKEQFHLGLWVVIICIALGLLCALSSLRASVKAMEQMTPKEKQEEKPPVSFDQHH